MQLILHLFLTNQSEEIDLSGLAYRYFIYYQATNSSKILT